MNEPLPGQKTGIVAGLAVLLQGAQAFGLVDAPTATLGQQVLALLAGGTLGLRVRRLMRGS